MKLTLIVFSIFLVSCSVIKNATTKKTASSELLKILSADSLEGRMPGTIGMEKATKFVENYYKSVGLKPLFFDSYRDTFDIYDVEAYNLVGVINAKNPTKEYILIGAHLDHLGVRHLGATSTIDSIYNGANDDASGVAVLLAIAQNKELYNCDKNILFVVFSGEESGLLGSQHLSRRLKQMNIDIKLVINFEMLGVPLKSTPDNVYMSGFSRSNFAEIANKSMGEAFVVYNEVDDVHDLFYYADNYSFYREYNIPSHTLCTYDFENDPNYHDVNDEYKNIDSKHLDKIAFKMSNLIQKLQVDQVTLTH